MVPPMLESFSLLIGADQLVLNFSETVNAATCGVYFLHIAQQSEYLRCYKFHSYWFKRCEY